MDWVMRQSTISRDFGLIWVDGTRLTDLDFADNVVLIDSEVAGVDNSGRAESQQSRFMCEFQ